MDSLKQILNYTFKDVSLLEEALTHPSCDDRDDAGRVRNYQRLEFLGDSVLGMVISEMLLAHFPHESEGHLARRKSFLVSGKTVSSVVSALQLENYIRLSDSEAQNRGAQNRSVQEDVGEALIGALYLDGGIKAAQSFIVAHWQERLQMLEDAPKDAKTALQEWSQAKNYGLPEYKVAEREGPAHAPVFTVEVTLANGVMAQAKAGSKRKAEQIAAEKLLQQVEK